MRFLGGRPGGTPAVPNTTPGTGLAQETAAVRSIVARLETLPPDQARFLASMAYVLARAANADLDISDVETAAMEQELANAGLDQSQALLVVEMAKLQEKTSGGTSDYLVTREFCEQSTPEQRLALLRACYHVAAADDRITTPESSVLFEIAGELELTREEAAQIRADFADKVSARFDFKGPGAGQG
jgi:uncharacterized tellurite resistance protein B-like protein